MIKYIKFFSSIALMAFACACSKEAPFDMGGETLMGQLSTEALSLEIKNEENLVRADVNAPDVNDFTVEIIKTGEELPAATYLYSKLPEIITLPVGEYTARAYYGENPDASFDAPYFYGSTEAFNIEPSKITSDIAPVVCRLSNVKVTVIFAESLASVMSADSKVSVSVGESGKLEFTGSETRSGYFAFVEGSNTLGAVFEGEVEGYPTVQQKAYDNVVPGNHYRLTFSLRSAGEGDPGTIGVGLNIDATVEVVDINGEVDAPDDNVIEDDMRPVEGGDEPGPGPDQPVVDGPSMSANNPLKLSEEGERIVNEVSVGDAVEIKILSDSGITAFTAEIISEILTPEELVGVDLDSRIDLLNPVNSEGVDMTDALVNFGFPVGDQVRGKKDVTFKITDFLGMIQMISGDEKHDHEFKLTVTDASGTSVKSLIIRI